MDTVPKGRWFCNKCQNQKRKLFSPKSHASWEVDEDRENKQCTARAIKRQKHSSHKSPVANEFVLASIANLGKQVASFVSGEDSKPATATRVKSEITELF